MKLSAVGRMSLKRPGETDYAPRGGAPTLATDERHMEKVKSVLERTRSISCTAVAKVVEIYPANVYGILTNSSGK